MRLTHPFNASLRPFGTTIFAQMSKLAAEHQAINLAQGFPDFDGPPEILDAAVEALRSGANQYSRSRGDMTLVTEVSQMVEDCYGLTYDPENEITVTCGATEGIVAALLGLLNPGDEVILFEPFYDSYLGCVALAGAEARICTLRFPDFEVDEATLAALFTNRTRVLVLNSPHNPTGKVFSRAELEIIARLAERHDVIVLSDEVYEFLTFDGTEHVPFASLPGMRERTLCLSSNSKTFSFTGWKVGWALGPPALIDAVQAAHQFLTFCAASPLQRAVAAGLRACRNDYLAQFRAEYAERRSVLLNGLRAAGFRVAVPRGTYFVLAGFSGLWNGDDRSFAEHLTRTVGVTPVPPSVFYRADPSEGQRLLRFAFCKRVSTLSAASERLRSLRPA